MSINEFFGFGGYTREAEGYMSFEHLLFVSILNTLMILLAVSFGSKYKNELKRKRMRPITVSAILIDSLEIFKIVILSFKYNDPFHFLYDLPLFLCSIQLITIPLCAFSKGRIKEASLDFVTVFGILGAVLGTYFAGNNYSAYPVLSFDNVVSGLTHCISGFASLYILISGTASMKKKNLPLTVGILGIFAVSAYVANIFTDCNYMFLSRGDGTPYDILYGLTSGNIILYPICVIVPLILYIILIYSIFDLKKQG